MSSNLLIVFVFALAGMAASPLLTRWAAARAPHQPVDADIDAERRLIAAVVADRKLVAEAAEIGVRAEHFTTGHRTHVWSLLAAEANADLSDLDMSEFADAGPLDDYDAANIRDLAADREIYTGAGPVAAGPDGELRRVYAAPAKVRYLAAAASCAFGFGFSSWAASTVTTGAAQVAATIALCITVALGFVLSSIDHDTLMLDYVSLGIGGAAAWAAAAATAYYTDWGRLLPGVIAAVLWFLCLTGLNLVFRLLRGIDGIGGGDWKIAAVCAAVPAVIADTFLVGFFAVPCGLVIALFIRVPQLITGKANRMTRFAMGPYIAIGWPLAWLYVNAQGML